MILTIKLNLDLNWTSGDHPNYCIIEIDQNTEKIPGDLRRLVTQTPVGRPSALADVKKTMIIIIIIIILYKQMVYTQPGIRPRK